MSSELANNMKDPQISTNTEEINMCVKELQTLKSKIKKDSEPTNKAVQPLGEDVTTMQMKMEQTQQRLELLKSLNTGPNNSEEDLFKLQRDMKNIQRELNALQEDVQRTSLPRDDKSYDPTLHRKMDAVEEWKRRFQNQIDDFRGKFHEIESTCYKCDRETTSTHKQMESQRNRIDTLIRDHENVKQLLRKTQAEMTDDQRQMRMRNPLGNGSQSGLTQNQAIQIAIAALVFLPFLWLISTVFVASHAPQRLVVS